MKVILETPRKLGAQPEGETMVSGFVHTVFIVNSTEAN